MFDGFIFGQAETALLLLRATLMCPVVDRIIISESNVTCAGRAKPLHALAVLPELDRLCPNKLLYVVAGAALSSGRRSTEARALRGHCAQLGLQFDALTDAFYSRLGGRDEDIITLTEHDEIIEPALLAAWRNVGLSRDASQVPPMVSPVPPVAVGMRTRHFYYYSGDCRSTCLWNGGLVVNGAGLRTGALGIDPYVMSRGRGWPGPAYVVQDRLWHLSTFMKPEEVLIKNVHAAHPECARPPYNTVEWQAQAQQSCVQFCGGEALERVYIDDAPSRLHATGATLHSMHSQQGMDIDATSMGSKPDPSHGMHAFPRGGSSMLELPEPLLCPPNTEGARYRKFSPRWGCRFAAAAGVQAGQPLLHVA